MRLWLRIPAAVAALLGLALVAAMVALWVVGVTIDLSRWRVAAEERLSTALERRVRLEGALELTLGRRATLHLGSARILNLPGFGSGEFVTISDVAAQFDLLAALRGQVQVHRFDAASIGVRLERAADGRVNWALPANAAPSERTAVDLPDIRLRNLAVEYHDARAGRRHVFAADEVSATGRRNEPLRLTLHGRAGQQVPYTLTVDGGPARLLQEASAPWPFSLSFVAVDTRFDAIGAVDVRRGEARFDFGAGTEDLAQVERLLDTELPRFGGAALHGTAVVAVDAIEVVELHGVLGESELAGRLAFASGGERPRLTGALTLATLDLRPLLAADPAPGNGRQERGNLPLRSLVPVDLDVDITVRELRAVPGELRDVRVELNANAQGVRAPIGATYAGVPFSGRLDFNTAAAVPVLAIQLEAKDAALGDLAGALVSTSGIEGRLARVGVSLSGRGETLAALVDDLELRLAAAGARMRARSHALTLDALDVAGRRGERLRGSARGTLQGERATLSFRGGTLPDMLHSRMTPFELDLAAAHAQLRVEGTLALPGAAGETDLGFGFRARRAGDLARWLAVAPNAKLPVGVRGRVRTASDAWYLDGMVVRLGRSTVTIDAHSSDRGAISVVAVRGPLIDMPELATLRAPTGRSGSRSDVPLLSDRIALPDADIGFGLQRVVLGRIDLIDVGLAAHVRGGRLAPSPIAARLAGTSFKGVVSLDLTGEVPDAALDLATGAIDVGRLLRDLGVAEDIDGRADTLDLALRARGTTPRDLAEHSSLDARVTGGSITVRGAVNQPVAQIEVKQAVVAVPAGGRIRVHVDGTLEENPVTIEVASGTLADLAHDATRVPLSVSAHAADARLTLAGDVLLPFGRGGELTLEMGGERLDTLNALARVELPPWGPWSVRGPIRMVASGYEVPGLVVSVGENRLTGDGRLDLTGPRPRLGVTVTAPSIQLDDFPLPERLTEDPPPTVTVQGVRATARGWAKATDRLMSAAFLRRLDAVLDVEVGEVLSGTDRLADGALRIQVIEGRLYLGPAQVNLPGGTLELAIAYDPNTPEVDFKGGAYIERFDYGILARRLHRAEGVRGLFSLKLELAGKAPSLDAIMRHANGRMDFAIWPEDLPSGVFNFWSINLLLAVLPLIDPGGGSHVNCIVGRFDLKDGVLSDDKIMIDTTRVRVGGAGSANLATDELAFVFRPRAKGFALFRLQTPLRVTGTLTDYRIGVERRDMPESILRLIASPILLPLERLTLGPLPRDGADLCTDPLRE